MVERHYLVVPVRPSAQKAVGDAVVASGGVLLFAAPSGALIVRMDDSVKEMIAGRVDVGHCGGVNVAPRAIRRIRVDRSGNRIIG